MYSSCGWTGRAKAAVRLRFSCQASWYSMNIPVDPLKDVRERQGRTRGTRGDIHTKAIVQLYFNCGLSTVRYRSRFELGPFRGGWGLEITVTCINNCMCHAVFAHVDCAEVTGHSANTPFSIQPESSPACRQARAGPSTSARTHHTPTDATSTVHVETKPATCGGPVTHPSSRGSRRARIGPPGGGFGARRSKASLSSRSSSASARRPASSRSRVRCTRPRVGSPSPAQGWGWGWGWGQG